MRLATIPMLALATLSVSCSSSPPPEQAAAPAKKEKEKTVIDAQLKAIDKAKAVQETVDQQKKDMDKKLEDAGG